MFARPSALAAACLLVLSCGIAHAKPPTKPAAKPALKEAAAKPAAKAAAKSTKPAKALKQKATAAEDKAPRSATPAAAPVKAASGKAPPKHADPAAFGDITRLVPTAQLGKIEDSVLAQEKAVRTQTLAMMMQLSFVAPSMLVEDADGDGRAASAYGSGVALARLQRLAARAELSNAATCLGKFADALTEGKKPLVLQFPDGCAGLKELQAGPALKNPKLEEMALLWSASTVRDGLAQARKAGLSYKARPAPVSLVAAFK